MITFIIGLAIGLFMGIVLGIVMLSIVSMNKTCEEQYGINNK